MTDNPITSQDRKAIAIAFPDGQPIDWDARLRAAVEQTLRNRASHRNTRNQLAGARTHGLAARHAAKLSRNAPSYVDPLKPPLTPPPPSGSTRKTLTTSTDRKAAS